MPTSHNEDARFWENYLMGYPGQLNIALELPRPPVKAFNKSVEHIPIGTESCKATYNYTDFIAALFILLYRYSGQKDIVIGILPPSLIRTGPGECNEYPYKPIPLRLAIDEMMPVSSMRDLVTQALEQVCQHCHSSKFSRPDTLDDGDTQSRLFQVIALPPEYPSEISSVNGVKTQIYNELSPYLASSDLALQYLSAGSRAELVCEFDSDLWGVEQRRRILGHLVSLLSKLDNFNAASVRDVKLVDGDEYFTLITQWSAGNVMPRADQSPYELVESRIVSNPDAVAVSCRESSITYRELGERVNHLASRLRREGVGAEVVVGLFTGRSSAYPVGFLAILKIGGVCVPLDTELPDERLRFVLNDSGCELIVTETDTSSQLADIDLPIVYLEEQPASSPTAASHLECARITADYLAYIVYTSGTTGAPKGVMINRGALTDLLVVQSNYFELGAETNMLWYASVGFDASVFEVLLPLVAGSTLIVAPLHARNDIHVLENFLLEHNVDIAILPPSLLVQMEPEHCPGLTKVVSVGEDCPESVALKWSGDRVFYNGYGPSEGTIASTVAAYAEQAGKPSIGRPIAHRRVYVLDHTLEPVPIGVVGELFIGGNALARGYLRLPAVTAASFIPDPFNPESGARMYRTGDLVRFRSDGKLEYVGRKDNQIQLRGLRIEPGEVEALLRAYPGVSEAVVVLHGSEADRRLVAFITLNADKQPVPHKLRNYLSNFLPTSLVPTDYRILDAMPLTANGKLDRILLGSLEPESEDAETKFVSPGTTTEKRVAQIWAEVFDVSRVGLNDDFFELGGQSLLIGKVMSRVRDIFHVELEARDLFEASTVTALANRISNKVLQQSASPDIASMISAIEDMTEEEVSQALAARRLDYEN